MVVKNINDLNLHDSNLIKVEFGAEDRIVFHIDYIDSYETFATKLKFLVFEGCRKVIMDVNFGYVPPNPILSASEVSDSDLVKEIVEKWNKIHILLDNLRHFYIETNTTNSKFTIIAERVLLLDAKPST